MCLEAHPTFVGTLYPLRPLRLELACNKRVNSHQTVLDNPRGQRTTILFWNLFQLVSWNSKHVHLFRGRRGSSQRSLEDLRDRWTGWRVFLEDLRWNPVVFHFGMQHLAKSMHAKWSKQSKTKNWKGNNSIEKRETGFSMSRTLSHHFGQNSWEQRWHLRPNKTEGLPGSKPTYDLLLTHLI